MAQICSLGLAAIWRVSRIYGNDMEGLEGLLYDFTSTLHSACKLYSPRYNEFLITTLKGMQPIGKNCMSVIIVCLRQVSGIVGTLRNQRFRFLSTGKSTVSVESGELAGCQLFSCFFSSSNAINTPSTTPSYPSLSTQFFPLNFNRFSAIPPRCRQERKARWW